MLLLVSMTLWYLRPCGDHLDVLHCFCPLSVRLGPHCVLADLELTYIQVNLYLKKVLLAIKKITK